MIIGYRQKTIGSAKGFKKSLKEKELRFGFLSEEMSELSCLWEFCCGQSQKNVILCTIIWSGNRSEFC